MVNVAKYTIITWILWERAMEGPLISEKIRVGEISGVPADTPGEPGSLRSAVGEISGSPGNSAGDLFGMVSSRDPFKGES